LQWHFLWRYGTHTAQEPRFTVLVSCSEYVRSFAFNGRIRSLGADCSTVGLYFV